jgi:hypothetical protein
MLVTFKGSSMLKLLRVVLAGFLTFIVLTVLAFVYLEWWQALIVVLAMIVAIVMGVRLIIRSLGHMLGESMIKLFDVKSQVLRGAEAEVHSVVPTAAPATDADEESDAPRDADYFRIDVTIKPAKNTGPMNHWDLDDLRVVPSDAPAMTMQAMSDEGVENIAGYSLQRVQVLIDGQFMDDAQGKYQGAQHIQALVGVPPHLRELKFQYYAEQFGRITLPPPLPRLS